MTKPRDRVLRIRLNPSELADLQTIADRTRLPVSTLARSILLGGIKIGKKPPL